MWSLAVSIYLIITLYLWHISYENCFISSDICLETSNFFPYLQTKIMWYCNRYLCLFLDFHVPMPWVYNNFWFLAILTPRLKPVGLRQPYFKHAWNSFLWRTFSYTIFPYFVLYFVNFPYILCIFNKYKYFIKNTQY